uniref:Snf7 family protein n=1 Tax=Fervidicoccus fontis TaxID=683846 RepID=A0A7J3ZL58_9CREN
MGSIEAFAKKWAPNSDKESVWKKLRNTVSPPPPARHRIAMALFKIRVQKSKMEYTLHRLQSRGAQLFEKVVDAQVKKDIAKATMYATEVAEVRKVAKALMSAIIALERISLRLETIQDVGDLITALGPVVGVIREVRSTLMGIMPEVAFELMEVDELLQSTVMELGEFAGIHIQQPTASEEARKVLEEATAIAEQRMKEQFPEIPVGSGSKLPEPPTVESGD